MGLGAVVCGLMTVRAASVAIMAPGTTAPGSPGDTTADEVLGQLNFTQNTPNLVDGLGLWMGLAGGDYNGDVAVDKSVSPNRIWVADTQNNRVLGWSSVDAFSSHAAASIVIGQADFISNACNEGIGVSATGLCSPTGVAVDGEGNLYVADLSNARVLEYNQPFASGISAGQAANLVFGQSSFSGEFCNSGGISAKTLCSPTGVAVDSAGNLYVADQGNNRVLEYFTPLSKTAMAGSGDTTADVVLGQLHRFNNATCNFEGPAPYSLCGPTGVALDGDDNLYVADTDNSRVLEYDATQLSAGNTYAARVSSARSAPPRDCATKAISILPLRPVCASRRAWRWTPRAICWLPTARTSACWSMTIR